MAARATNMQSNADKGLDEKLMDEYLNANGLYRRKIAKDGSCLFRAVAEQVLHCQALHTEVRAECVKYLRQNRELYELFIEGDFEEYLQRLQDPQSWVGQVEISALAVLYKHDFIIYQNPGEPPANITENGFRDKVQLCFLNGNHYDSVYPISFSKNAAICQSILYELLYERVCGVDRSVLTASLKGPKVKDEAKLVESKDSEESDLDEGEDFWSSEANGKTTVVNNRPPYKGRGRGQTRGGGRGILPPDAQNSLNPVVFRNVAYDVWMRSKKAQQRRDFFMAAGMQYTAGDKCQVRLSSTGHYYSAYIQEVGSNEGPVTVFIEELGQKHTVPLWNLRTPSEEPWSTIPEKGKRHSVTNGNGHVNEWETRGSRRPVRSMSSSLSSPPTTDTNPISRVQKQHSWPPQAPVEAPFRGKIAENRKPDQDIGGLGVSPAEEEELLVLELLHKDENNFPTLEASAQAAGEGSRKAERKGSRKKAEMETKEQPQKPDQKTDRGKKKGSSVQNQRISLPIKEKPNPSPPPASPPSANSPTPSAPKAAPTSAPAAAQTASAQSKTGPVSSAPLVSAKSTCSQSENAPVVSITTSGSAQAAPAQCQTASVPATAATSPQTITPQSQTTPRASNYVSTLLSSTPTSNSSKTAPVPTGTHSTATPVSKTASVPTATPAASSPFTQTISLPLTTHAPKHGNSPLSPPTTVTTPGHSQAALVPNPSHTQVSSAHCQTAPATTPVLSQTTSAATQSLDPTPVLSQSAPETTPDTDSTPSLSHITPVSSVTDSKVPLRTVPPPVEFAGASTTTPTLLPVSAHSPPVPAHAPNSVTPPSPVNASAGPTLTPFHSVGLGSYPMLPHYPPYMPAAPTSAPILTPPPYEPSSSPGAGVGPPTMPDYMSHHPQHSFPVTQLSHLYHDLLYPGFPQNEKDEPVHTFNFSFQHNGEDLPKDTSVLRFFFNLGVKAFFHQLIPPFTYLAPLTRAYQLQPKVAPLSSAPSSSHYPPPWQSDSPSSMLQINSAPNQSHIGPPVSHFEVQNVVSGPPPLEEGGYGSHPHSVPIPMPPQPGVPWTVAPCTNVFAGIYSAGQLMQYPTPPCPPTAQAHSSFVGYQRPPVPPPQHCGMNISMAPVALATERGEGDGQRSLTPQVEKPLHIAGGQPHSGGEDYKPAVVPASMELQQAARASPVVQVVPVGCVPSEGIETTKLTCGHEQEDDNTKSFEGGASVGLVQSSATVNEWELQEGVGDPDLRSGRSYYSRSFRPGGRRGQDDRGGGFRGRGSRGRRDYSGRGRPFNQQFHYRGYGRGRGRGYDQGGYGDGQFAPAAEPEHAQLV